MTPENFLFGAAYYDEYMPYDRIDTDFSIMKQAGMNVIRIAESTWSTWEPADGVFDFTHLHRMLDKASEYDIKVIIGTPTYAVPAWLVKKYPDILPMTGDGQAVYGHRQLHDITNPDYRRYAERIIRKLMEEAASHPQVIGYQLDNETRSGGSISPETQHIFINRMKEKYPDIREFNHEFGLDYWSNRIDKWEDFPDIGGTINGSLSAAYRAFLRDLITEFLHWQADIVREYKSDDQFITHNFDYSWKGYSFGMHPEVDQKECAACLDIAGTDIYHQTQDDLDGAMIAFGGALSYGLKASPYLVLETQAQGNISWLPYPGQLRLHAYSHIAAGARSVMYWNWHSIHNARESYWKGVLGHDLRPGAIYDELRAFREEMSPWESHLLLKEKKNDVAILADHASLVGIDEFPYSTGDDPGQYNELLRKIYDTLYKMNIETDIIYADNDFSEYKLIIVPMLYSVSEKTIEALKNYVENGGSLFLTFRSLYADENLKIYHDMAPHGFTALTGMSYNRFTIPKNVSIRFTSDTENTDEKYPVSNWMELLDTETADVWARYEHPAWGGISAITHKRYGRGNVTYLGADLDGSGYRKLFEKLTAVCDISCPEHKFPIIIRTGTNLNNNKVLYIFNYSPEEKSYTYTDRPGRMIIDETGAVSGLEAARRVADGDVISIPAWSLVVIEIMQI
ncbi:MAG: beta-galactosidase [Eubacterium sp.]|nr:beta-galactosidase [Eubacterium sp.]